MNLFAKISRVTMIVVLCVTFLGRFALSLSRNSFPEALKDAFAFGMLITLAFGFVLSMGWAAACGVQYLKGRQTV